MTDLIYKRCDMKKVLFCLMITTFVNVHAMNSSALLTEEEKDKCASLFSTSQLEKMKNSGSLLREGIKDDTTFLKTLRDFADSSVEVSSFASLLRGKRILCEPKVRQIMYQNIASSLASFSESLKQKQLKQRILRVADDQLIETLVRVGLFVR